MSYESLIVRGVQDDTPDATSDERAIVALQQLNLACLQTNSLGDLKEIRDRAEAVRVYAKAAARSLELQNEAAEVRLRAERKAGVELGKMRIHGGDRRSKAALKYLNLGALGITRNQSRAWQQIAAIPERQFEEYLRHCREQKLEMTESGLLRHAKGGMAQEEGNDLARDAFRLDGVRRRLAGLIADGKHFECICVFPQWPQARLGDRGCQSGDKIRAYTAELSRLPLAEVAADQCHLHLWTSSERMLDAIRLGYGWRFTFRDVLVCERSQPVFGKYFRSEQDFMVLLTKGNLGFRGSGVSSRFELGATTVAEQQVAVRRLLERASSPPLLSVLGSAAKQAGWTIIPCDRSECADEFAELGVQAAARSCPRDQKH